MPRYAVELIHEDSGRTRTTEIDAPSSEAARDLSSGGGWLASTAERLSDRRGDDVAMMREELMKLRESVAARPAAHLPDRKLKRDEFLCPNPNCGYFGKKKKVARGSTIVLLILLCFMILPGILYALFMGGYRYYCPKCNTQLGSDN